MTPRGWLRSALGILALVAYLAAVAAVSLFLRLASSRPCAAALRAVRRRRGRVTGATALPRLM